MEKVNLQEKFSLFSDHWKHEFCVKKDVLL